MEQLFLQVVNMGFTAGCVILFVMVARLCLTKAPKRYAYALWSVVLFRLLCPVSIQSVFSLLPVKAQPIRHNIGYGDMPQIDTGIPLVDNVVNPVLPPATPQGSVNPMQLWISMGTVLWLAGMAVLLACSLLALWKLHRRLGSAVHLQHNIYTVEGLDTAFVLGLFHPRIYLPQALSAEERRYILLHEQIHIRRFDHVIRVVSFVVLCVYWWHPLVWAAFLLSGKDMEMACDEAVIRQLGNGVKKEYSSSLLTLATGRKVIGGTPLAFGEGDTGSRIRHVLHYKKPAVWVAVGAGVAVIGICIGLITNPAPRMASMQWAKTLRAEDVTKLELVTMPAPATEQYRLFGPDEYGEIIALMNGSRGRYVANPEAVAGSSTVFYITTGDGVRHWAGNMGNRYLIIDGDHYQAGYSWLSTWNYGGNAPLPSGFDFGNGDVKPTLTLDVLRRLAEKKEALSWSDFAPYHSVDVGHGLYILHYEMEEGYYLRVGGFGPDSAPLYTSLCRTGTEEQIDIRTSDVEAFLQSNRADQWDLRPMLMADGVLYLDTGRQAPVPPEPSTILGEIVSSVAGSERPTEHGQSNFGCIGAAYAAHEDGILVALNGTWTLFEPEGPKPEEAPTGNQSAQTVVYEGVEIRHYDDGAPYIHDILTNGTDRKIVSLQHGMLAYDAKGQPLKLQWNGLDSSATSSYYFLYDWGREDIPAGQTKDRPGGWSLFSDWEAFQNPAQETGPYGEIAYILYIIKEITFEDGTVWQNPDYKNWVRTYEGKTADVELLRNYYPHAYMIS